MERVRRRWWTATITLAAGVVVFGALLTAIFQLVMLIAPGYREDLAAYVSRVAGQPVDIGGVGLGWSGLAPRLELSDITLYGEDGQTPALSAERVRLGFGVMRLVNGDTTPQRLELSGVELFAQIDAEGRFSLRGLDTSGMPARGHQDWLRQLGRFQSVRLSRCELLLQDARLRGAEPRFRLIDAEIEFSEGEGEASAELALPASMGSRVRLNARIRGDLERPDTWNGRWNLRVDGLAGLPWIDAALAPDAALGFRSTELVLDGAVSGGHLGAMDLRLDAGALVGRKAQREFVLRDLGLSAHLQPEAQGWTLDVSSVEASGTQGPWPESQARVRLLRGPDGAPWTLEAQASYLNLGDLAPWLHLLPEQATLAERIGRATGALRALVLRFTPDPAGARYSLRADLDAFGLSGGEHMPGVEGISGGLSASESGGRLDVREGPLALNYAKVFARTVAFERVSAQIDWTRTGQGWQLRAPRIDWALEGGRGEGVLDLFLPRAGAGSPRIKLDTRFSAADVTRFKPYMPLFWHDHLRQWLDRAIVAGRAPAGRLRIEGELADFPFDAKPGLFALDIDAADAHLAFAPDWPAVERLAAHLEFRGNALAIRGDSGTVSGTRVEKVEARIDNLRDPRLQIAGEAQGDAARFYEFLRASPLAAPLSGLLTRTRAAGDAVVAVALDVPLHQVKDTRALGEVRLRGVRLDVEGLPEPVRDVRGSLAFHNHGVSADALQASLYATPVLASLGQDESGALQLLASFEFKPDAAGTGASALLPAFLRTRLEGSSRWQAAVPLNGEQAGRVRLSSDLQGLALRLPAPLDKPAGDAWPTTLDLGSDRNFPLRATLALADRVGMDLAFDRRDADTLELQRARIRSGPGAPPRAEDDGIFIGGTAAELEPLRWIAALGASSDAPEARADTAAGARLPVHADLNVGRLRLGGTVVEGVRLTHAPAPAGWQTRISGNGALGELSLRNTDDGPVLSGRFPRVQLVHRAREPITPAPATTSAGGAPLDPARLPRLDVVIEDLQAGEAQLGRLDLRTTRIADGQRIELLRSTGKGGALDASGEWRRRDGRSSASLRARLESDAIAELLRAAGYAPSLSARRSLFEAQLQWPENAASAGAGIKPALAQGELKLQVDNGMLRAVEPGAGRVLGLINFWALPRRLTLDFRDVLSEGLAVDRIRGRFRLENGVAVTDDLDIQGPSLKMEVRGNVGLAARTYDQRVRVYPDVSAGVTLGALLIGGPAAAALALVAQEVLDQPLDQVGQLGYRLTGSWDDPQVVREGGLLSSDDESAPPAVPAPPRAAPVTPGNFIPPGGTR